MITEKYSQLISEFEFVKNGMVKYVQNNTDLEAEDKQDHFITLKNLYSKIKNTDIKHSVDRCIIDSTEYSLFEKKSLVDVDSEENTSKTKFEILYVIDKNHVVEIQYAGFYSFGFDKIFGMDVDVKPPKKLLMTTNMFTNYFQFVNFEDILIFEPDNQKYQLLIETGEIPVFNTFTKLFDYTKENNIEDVLIIGDNNFNDICRNFADSLRIITYSDINCKQAIKDWDSLMFQDLKENSDAYKYLKKIDSNIWEVKFNDAIKINQKNVQLVNCIKRLELKNYVNKNLFKKILREHFYPKCDSGKKYKKCCGTLNP